MIQLVSDYLIEVEEVLVEGACDEEKKMLFETLKENPDEARKSALKYVEGLDEDTNNSPVEWYISMYDDGELVEELHIDFTGFES